MAHVKKVTPTNTRRHRRDKVESREEGGEFYIGVETSRITFVGFLQEFQKNKYASLARH